MKENAYTIIFSVRKRDNFIEVYIDMQNGYERNSLVTVFMPRVLKMNLEVRERL